MTRTIIGSVCATVLGIATFGTAAAEEVTLRAASSFAEGTTFSREFERFIDKVNAEGAGLVQIQYVGGPEAIPPFETGNAVQSGVIDIANTTGAFYTNVLPIADALKLAEISAQEMRENGAYEFIDQLHREKMNVHYLARTGIGIPFHLYVNKEISGPDLSGLRLRVTPVYRAFFTELGATAIQTPPGEVYTALERGVVDGYGWPVQGILDLGWQDHTQYRVDPGFYTVDVSFLVNLDTWNGLTEEQRNFLTEMAVWTESLNAENEALNAEDRQAQAEAGIETIELTGAAAEEWLKTAYEAGWEEAIAIDPENGPRLRELISR